MIDLKHCIDVYWYYDDRYLLIIFDSRSIQANTKFIFSAIQVAPCAFALNAFMVEM